jgi:hypothetical protein
MVTSPQAFLLAFRGNPGNMRQQAALIDIFLLRGAPP